MLKIINMRITIFKFVKSAIKKISRMLSDAEAQIRNDDLRRRHLDLGQLLQKLELAISTQNQSKRLRGLKLRSARLFLTAFSLRL